MTLIDYLLGGDTTSAGYYASLETTTRAEWPQLLDLAQHRRLSVLAGQSPVDLLAFPWCPGADVDNRGIATPDKVLAHLAADLVETLRAVRAWPEWPG